MALRTLVGLLVVAVTACAHAVPPVRAVALTADPDENGSGPGGPLACFDTPTRDGAFVMGPGESALIEACVSDSEYTRAEADPYVAKFWSADLVVLGAGHVLQRTHIANWRDTYWQNEEWRLASVIRGRRTDALLLFHRQNDNGTILNEAFALAYTNRGGHVVWQRHATRVRIFDSDLGAPIVVLHATGNDRGEPPPVRLRLRFDGAAITEELVAAGVTR